MLTVVFTAPVVSSVELDKTAFTIAPKAEDVDTGAFIIDSKSCEFINDGYNCFKAESHSVSMGKVKYTLIPIEEKEWKENRALIPVKMKKKFFIDYVREKNYEKVKEMIDTTPHYVDITAIARFGDRTMVEMCKEKDSILQEMARCDNPAIFDCIDLIKIRKEHGYLISWFQVFCETKFDIFKAFWRQFGTPENIKVAFQYGLTISRTQIIDPQIMQYIYENIVLPIKNSDTHMRDINMLHEVCGSPACIRYLMDIKVFDKTKLTEKNKWILNPDYVVLFPQFGHEYFKFPYEAVKDCIEIILENCPWKSSILGYYRKYNYYKHKELLERLFKEIPPTEIDMYYMKYVNTD